jgi:hypothetical protein
VPVRHKKVVYVPIDNSMDKNIIEQSIISIDVAGKISAKNLPSITK